jgi:hypothetical protein
MRRATLGACIALLLATENLPAQAKTAPEAKIQADATKAERKDLLNLTYYEPLYALYGDPISRVGMRL